MVDLHGRVPAGGFRPDGINQLLVDEKHKL